MAPSAASTVAYHDEHGRTTLAARALVASFASSARLAVREGTSEGLRVAMIITPTILGIMVLGLLLYFAYSHWLKRRGPPSGPTNGVSPFTWGAQRRAVDLVTEMPGMGSESREAVLGTGSRTTQRERRVGDEKDPFESLERNRDRGLFSHGDRKSERKNSRGRDHQARAALIAKKNGSGSTVAAYSGAETDPFDFIDRERVRDQDVHVEMRDVKRPLPLAHGERIRVLDMDSPSSPLASPGSPGGMKAGRRAKGPPTPIDIVVTQSFPVAQPTSAPMPSTGINSARVVPFTPLPGYPTSATLVDAPHQASFRDSKLMDAKRALDSPTEAMPGQAFAAQNNLRTPANARRGNVSTRSKHKLQVVNQAIKKNRGDRKSSSTVNSSSATATPGSTSPTQVISMTAATGDSAPSSFNPLATGREPPFYSRPPSYVFSHGRSSSATGSDMGQVNFSLASPASMKGSMFNESDIFPTNMSTADASSIYGAGRRSYASSRWSQDVQAVAGPSSRPLSPYSPGHDAPPVPALPMPPSAFALAKSSAGTKRASATSSRRNRRPVKGSASTPVSAPTSAYPPDSASTSSPVPPSATRAPARDSLMSEMSMDITSAAHPRAATASPLSGLNRGAARMSLGGPGDAKSAYSVDMTSMRMAGSSKRNRHDSIGSDDGVPAIPPLPFDLGGSFGLGMISSDFGVDPIQEDADEAQSVGGHSVSNSLSGLLDRKASFGKSSVSGVASPATATSSANKFATRSDSLPSLRETEPSSEPSLAPPLPVASTESPAKYPFLRTRSSPALNDPSSTALDSGTFGPAGSMSSRRMSVRRKPVPSDASQGTVHTLGSGSDLGLIGNAARPGSRGRLNSVEMDFVTSHFVEASGDSSRRA